MNILTLQDFSKAYNAQNPHDKVDIPKAIRWPVESIMPLIIGLIAVNVLSASHTAPVISQSVPTPYFEIKVVVAIAGFLGVEFLMFSANFVARSKISPWKRNLLVLLALAVAIVANVGSVVGTLSVQSDFVSLVSGGLIGVFAPIANFVTGEMLRDVLDQTKVERVEAQTTYKDALIQYDVKMRTRYVNYLKRVGITDPTEIMKLSAGELPKHDELVDKPIDAPTTIQLQLPPAEKPKTKAELLADTLELRGDAALSFKQIEVQYGSNPATINAAKKILRQRGLIQ